MLTINVQAVLINVFSLILTHHIWSRLLEPITPQTDEIENELRRSSTINNTVV